MFARPTRLMLLSTALPVALLAGSLRATAEEGARANVTVRVSATVRGAATNGSATTGPPFAVGDVRTMSVGAQCTKDGRLSVTTSPFRDQSGRSGYQKSEIGPEPSVAGGVVNTSGDAETEGEYHWMAQVRLVAIGVDTVTFETNWSRSQSVNGIMQRVAGDVRTIRLRAGEHHVLDFVNQPDNPIANLVFEVEAARVEDPAYANTVLDYDLWLVHETAAGQKLTRHEEVNARNAQDARFMFDPFAFPLSANEAVDGRTGPLNMFVRGSIKGRVRPDGTIEVAMHSMLAMGSGVRRDSNTDSFSADRWRGSSSGAGDKTFTVKPGETVAIEYPVPSGMAFWGKMDVDRPRPGVTLERGGAKVDDAAFLAGSKTRLLLTVKRHGE